MLYIDQVHEEKDSQGRPVITRLKYTDNLYALGTQECSKADMVAYVQNHPNTVKTKYLSRGVWVSGEFVHVVEGRYLRTDSNGTRADNLGNLIKY